ncbi:MAG: hypothetical protein NWF00_05270 [Candidatus Bathyarchaeota archaeon]|nr:hypothetical protein [Candidatus Bathyarchaeota archaeon]
MANPEIKIYLNIGGEWVDFQNNATAFKVEDKNLLAVPHATVNLEGFRSDFTDYISSPYCLSRLQIKPVDAEDFYSVFYGYVHAPRMKVIPGTLTNKVKLSLDMCGGAQRLASDFITFDYYTLQSAISPYTDTDEKWTYRRMIQDFLDHPDSTCDGTGLSGTGFTVCAEENSEGIDANIDASCSWNGQSLLEAIRTTCDRIGYDGYCFVDDLLEAKVNLYPYSKTSVATLADPFVGEPEIFFGDINDVANVVFVTGGIDMGIPSDGDRLTEFVVAKYSPAAWSVALLNNAFETGTGDASITDADNTDFEEVNRSNSKCVRVRATNTTDTVLRAVLDLSKTEYGSVDIANRVSMFSSAFRLVNSSPGGGNVIYVRLFLTDTNGLSLCYIFANPENSASSYWAFNTETALNVNLRMDTEIIRVSSIPAFGNYYPNRWFAIYPATPETFDWEHVTIATIEVKWGSGAPTSGLSWGFDLDGLVFEGGYDIKPFAPYSATLNPPVQDSTSQGWYGTHVLNVNDNTIGSFDQAHAEGQRLLANLAYPHPQLTVKKSSAHATQLRPSDVVTVDSVDRRISQMTYEWSSKNKRIDVEYKLLEATAPLPPLWSQLNELRLLVK